MKILYVAYPLLPLSDDIAGGAEQVLLSVAREVASLGHEVTIAAAEGSIVPGRLLATGRVTSRVDDFERRSSEHESAILEHLAEHEHDVVHDMSGSFWRRSRSVSTPLLATLHLPPEFYPTEAFRRVPNDLMFNGVSCSQARRFSEVIGVEGLEIVANGISVERFSFTQTKQDYLLWLGRICEEKAPHVAIEIAEGLGVPLILAGQIYPFSYHQQYFDRQVRPRLRSGNMRFINAPNHAKKVELLRNARALLISSTAEETSSLVAMEAMACGTPVVALRRGALPEVIRDGTTGFIVDHASGIREAVEHIDSIMPLACREHVARLFSASRMASDYLRIYEQLLADRKLQAAPRGLGTMPQAA